MTMSEIFAMNGHGPYVWAAYGITLAVLIWNVWSAKTRLSRNLRDAARERQVDEAPKRPKVSQL